MIQAKLEAGNLAQAEVTSASQRAVHVRIDAEDRWDAAGVRQLRALLGGIAATLESVERG